MLQTARQLDLFKDSLPSRGFATDDLSTGLHFVPLSELILRAQVQYNWKHSVKYLAYDDDSDDALFNWEDRNCPPPNLLIRNGNNGHAHLLYALETPVHKYDENRRSGKKGPAAKQAPLRFLGAVDVALTETLGADPGYTKLICKNPLSTRWEVYCFRQETYDLNELASWLDLSKYSDKRRRLPDIGYGRNCTLFERLRLWAYKERRNPALSQETFLYRVRTRAMALNAEFEQPLPFSEVRSTAKSIGNWTWVHMSAEGFKAWQSKNGKRSGVVRRAKALELREKLVEARESCPTLTQGDIADLYGVTRQTVNKHLKEYKRTISDKEGVKRTISDKGAEK